jgi:hypothetical protein
LCEYFAEVGERGHAESTPPEFERHERAKESFGLQGVDRLDREARLPVDIVGIHGSDVGRNAARERQGILIGD